MAAKYGGRLRRFLKLALGSDAGRRELEWFAYWVLGKPTQRMLDRYGQPPIAEWKN